MQLSILAFRLCLQGLTTVGLLAFFLLALKLLGKGKP